MEEDGTIIAPTQRERSHPLGQFGGLNLLKHAMEGRFHHKKHNVLASDIYEAVDKTKGTIVRYEPDV